MEGENTEIKLNLRGDDLKIIIEIKEYLPTDREDIWSWIVYIEKQFKNQTKK